MKNYGFIDLGGRGRPLAPRVALGVDAKAERRALRDAIPQVRAADQHPGALTEGGRTPNILGETCRNGHRLTYRNTKRDERGHLRCLDCRESNTAYVERPCAGGCGTPISHTRSPYCDPCKAAHEAQRATKRTRAPKQRTCVVCHVAQDLAAQFRTPNWSRVTHAGIPQYVDTCLSCRRAAQTDDEPADAPYEVARLEVERLYGLPSAQWINVPDHPLSMLQYALMVQYNNAALSRLGAEPIAVGPIWNVRTALDLVARAGYRPIQENAA